MDDKRELLNIINEYYQLKAKYQTKINEEKSRIRKNMDSRNDKMGYVTHEKKWFIFWQHFR